MSPLRIMIIIVLALLVLLIGGCVLYGVGTAETDVPTSTQTETTP